MYCSPIHYSPLLLYKSSKYTNDHIKLTRQQVYIRCLRPFPGTHLRVPGPQFGRPHTALDCPVHGVLHLFTDGVQGVGAAACAAQLHVHGVVEQGQAATGLQHPVGLLEETRPVEPVEGRHGGHQIYGAGGGQQPLGPAQPGWREWVAGGESCCGVTVYLIVDRREGKGHACNS